MPPLPFIHELLPQVVAAAFDAGQAILRLYTGPVTVEYKADHSPLTAADRAAHSVITAALTCPDGYALLSEEGRETPFAERAAWPRYWLVDPLDGSKEFLKHNGEFTVNIALIEAGRPILGVVYAPVPGTVYAGVAGAGAWKASPGAEYSSREDLLAGAAAPAARWLSLPLAPRDPTRPVRVIASRSHMNDATRAFIAGIEAEHGPVSPVSIGSSLKLCLIAEGSVDVYPRIAPTMEWDTAAAQAVLEAAGGSLREFATDQPLHYNKPSLLNPFFVARRAGWPGVPQARMGT